MKNKETILVTGVGGNVGQYIADYLSKNQYNIYGIYHHNVPKNVNYSLIQANLAFDEIDLSNVNTVIHCAACIEGSSEEIVLGNIYSTYNLVKQSKKYGIKKFIYASSVSVHGKTKGILSDESGIVDPGLYGSSKYVSQEIVLDSGIESCIVLQLPRMLGPYVNLLETKGSGFLSMVYKILRNEDIECYIPDVRYNNYMHVSSLAKFIDVLLQSEISIVDTIAIGTGNVFCMRKILDIMVSSIESSSQIYEIETDVYTPTCSEVDISKAVRYGYEPENTADIIKRYMIEMKEKYFGLFTI